MNWKGKIFHSPSVCACWLGGAVLLFFGIWLMLRTQTAISDKQWMQGMIPHHSSAILTCENAELKNPEVQKLTKEIIRALEREIAEMKQLLREIERQQVVALSFS